MIGADYDQIAEWLRTAENSKYSFQDIKARFESERVSTYGDSMDEWIPDFEYAHQLLRESLAIHIPSGQARGVELGAGTGRVSGMLLETFQDLRLTLVDLSPNMLHEAERRLGVHTQRCEFMVHDMFERGLRFPERSLDCVVSVFAICHGQGMPAYADLYARIHRWLKPGGIFICYDHVRGDTFPLTALNALGWHRLLLTCSTADEAKEGIVSTYQEDSPLSLREHLQMLSSTGFSGADVLHKRDIFAIYAAVR